MAGGSLVCEVLLCEPHAQGLKPWVAQEASARDVAQKKAQGTKCKMINGGLRFWGHYWSLYEGSHYFCSIMDALDFWKHVWAAGPSGSW